MELNPPRLGWWRQRVAGQAQQVVIAPLIYWHVSSLQAMPKSSMKAEASFHNLVTLRLPSWCGRHLQSDCSATRLSRAADAPVERVTVPHLGVLSQEWACKIQVQLRGPSSAMAIALGAQQCHLAMVISDWYPVIRQQLIEGPNLLHHGCLIRQACLPGQHLGYPFALHRKQDCNSRFKSPLITTAAPARARALPQTFCRRGH